MALILILTFILASILYVRAPKKKFTVPTTIKVKAWEESMFGQGTK